jgi:hypothetical protein
MRWSVTNPRIVIPCGLGAIAFALIMEAYSEYPHVCPGFGVVQGIATIHASEIGGNALPDRFRNLFENRLRSPRFIEQFMEVDTRCRALYQDTGTAVVRFDTKAAHGLVDGPAIGQFAEAMKGRNLTFTTMAASNGDLSVFFLTVRGYGVSQPSFSWIGWLQERLPGMPDRERLSKDAVAANEAVKEVIEQQIRKTASDAAVSVGAKPTSK